jgi:hypothetical protein
MEASQTPGSEPGHEQDPQDPQVDPAATEDAPAEGAQPGDQGEQVAGDAAAAGFDPSQPVRTSAPPPEAQSGTPGQEPGGVNATDGSSGATEGGQSPQGPDQTASQGGPEAGTDEDAVTGGDAPLSDAAADGGQGEERV